MPGPDVRDPASYQQNNPGNPQIRNPYGNQTWNQGGQVFTMNSGRSNSYGWGDNNYGSTQAQLAYENARRTSQDVDQRRRTTNADGTNALTGVYRSPYDVRNPSDDVFSRTAPDTFVDYAAGDRANSEYSGGNPYMGMPGTFPFQTNQNTGFGGPQRVEGGDGTSPILNSTTTQGMPPTGGQNSSGLPAYGGPMAANSSSGGGGNPYGVSGPRSFEHPSVSEDPRMGALLQTMNSSAGLDNRRAQEMFDLWKRKQTEGQGQENYLTQLYGDVLGRSGKSFDPNNPATFALMAPQMQAVAAEKDAMLRALEASGLSGGELEAAKARAITGAYGQGAQLRQGQVQNALGYFQNLANIDQHGFDPGQSSNAAAQMLGYYGQKYGTDVNAANQLYATDVGAENQRYGIDVGAAGQRYGVDTGAATSRYSTDKSYDLGLQQLTAQQKAQAAAQKQGLWGGLLKTLGGLASNKMSGGSGGGGGSNYFSNFGSNNGSFDSGGNYSYLSGGNPVYGDYTPNGYALPPNNNVWADNYDVVNGYQPPQQPSSIPSFLDPNSGYTGNETWTPGGGMW